MAQPVWILSVDLQAKTATFQTGMADAARSARGAFNDIGGGAEGMGRRMGSGMTEARHSVMLLGEEFGVHIPRAVASFIASLGPVGAALEAAFPFMAIIVGATLLIEHLAKMREAGEKLTEDQVKFGTACQTAFNKLEEKLIQSQIRADELKNDHLGALKLQLELIDKQSMDELVHSFDLVAKAADVVMKDLEGHWYTFGIGSDGANHALQQFGIQYESLLAQGKSEEASGLLKGTLAQAQKTRDMMSQFKGSQAGDGNSGDYQKFEVAAEYLRQRGLLSKITGEFTEKELQAQEQLVEALQKQVGIEGEVAAIKKQDGSNAARQMGNEEASKRAAAARQAAESQLRIGEQSIAADKATAEAALTIHRASLEERLASDIEFAGRDRDAKQAANGAEIAALDKSGKDYQNQLKALQEKVLETNAEYAAKVTELKAKASVEENQRTIATLEAAIREEIAGTQNGSAQRLSVIAAAMKQEENLGLEQTSFYRELAQQREETLRTQTAQEEKLTRESTEVQVQAMEKAAQEQIKNRAAQMSLQSGEGGGTQSLARLALDKQIADMEYQVKRQEIQRELELYRQAGMDQTKEAQKANLQLAQLDQQHTDQVKLQQEQQASAIRQSWAQISTGYAQTFMGVLQGHRSLTAAMGQLADQAAERMIAASMQVMMGNKSEQLSSAKTAAAGAWKAMASIPVVGPELGAVAAAAVFAGAMAFEGGTDRVPGVGRGDIVPSMLTPGEGIVPGGVMDGLRNMARNGGFEQGPRYTIHAPIHMSASVMDADGVDKVFTQHSDRIQKHFENTLRRMNR